MDSKPIIREIRSSDIDEVLSLHNAQYGDNRTAEQWNWEYKGNYPDLSIFTVIEDNGAIVGTNGRIPIYINIKGERHLSGKGESFWLHPKYRGGTLSTELVEFAMPLCKEKSMSCLWGYGTAHKVSRKLGWTVFEGILNESILILNLRSTLSSLFKSQRGIQRKIILSLMSLLGYSYSFMYRFYFMHVKKYRDTNFSIEHELKSTNDISMLYARLRAKYPNLIHIDQDEKYLEWRIYNNPNIKYDTYFLYEENSLRGYCYVGVRDNERATLTDLTFETDAAGAFLLKHVLNNLRRRKIGYVYFLGNVQNPLMITNFDLLKKFGFLKRKHNDHFSVRNLSYEDEEHLFDIKNWYIGGLWTEGYTT